MQPNLERLKNGVVLAELGGYGDGPYCATHGAGAALVMMGTYIVDDGEHVPYDPRFVFKPGWNNYIGYLRENITAARRSGAQVGVSVCANKLSDNVDFLQAAQTAGADYASYCAHSTMDMFLRANTSSALCRRENWLELRRWAKTMLEAVEIPVIFKVGCGDTPDAVEAVRVLTEAGVPVVHVNVEETEAGSEGLGVLEKLRGSTPFLIVGGGIKDIEGARRVLAAGADAVAFGTAAMKDPDLCGRIQRILRCS